MTLTFTKQERDFAKRIVREAIGGSTVTLGKTNGETVYHVATPGRGAEGARTVRTLADWNVCPLNEDNVPKQKYQEDELVVTEVIYNEDAI